MRCNLVFFISAVRVVLLVVVPLRSVEGTEKDPSDGFVDSHQSKLESISDIHLRVERSLKPKNDDGKTARYKYEWMWTSSGEEYLRIERDLGAFDSEFSGRTYQLGNVESYNGTDGFVCLEDYDGTLINGILGCDSPARARIAKKVPFISGVVPWADVALHPLGNPPMPLWQLLESSRSRSSKLLPTGLVKVDCELENGDSYSIKMDPERDLLLTGYDFNKPDVEKLSVRVDKFLDIPGWGSFPARVTVDTTNKQGGNISVTSVKLISLNEAIPKSKFLIDLPPGVPFVMDDTGKFGIWGRGEPELFFSSEEEGMAWLDRERSKLRSMHLSRDSKLSWTFTSTALALLLLIGFLVFRNARKRRGSLKWK